jgi:hypothetical protein
LRGLDSRSPIVELLTGKRIPVEVSYDAIAACVKAKVQAQEQMRMDAQRPRRRGKVMYDDEALSACEIGERDTIKVRVFDLGMEPNEVRSRVYRSCPRRTENKCLGQLAQPPRTPGHDPLRGRERSESGDAPSACLSRRDLVGAFFEPGQGAHLRHLFRCTKDSRQ